MFTVEFDVILYQGTESSMKARTARVDPTGCLTWQRTQCSSSYATHTLLH